MMQIDQANLSFPNASAQTNGQSKDIESKSLNQSPEIGRKSSLENTVIKDSPAEIKEPDSNVSSNNIIDDQSNRISDSSNVAGKLSERFKGVFLDSNGSVESNSTPESSQNKETTQYDQKGEPQAGDLTVIKTDLTGNAQSVSFEETSLFLGSTETEFSYDPHKENALKGEQLRKGPDIESDSKRIDTDNKQSSTNNSNQSINNQNALNTVGLSFEGRA